ncbi:MAG: hypothetical protein Tsb002_32090 [Wenzhouxiangellaceae bacterium]
MKSKPPKYKQVTLEVGCPNPVVSFRISIYGHVGNACWSLGPEQDELFVNAIELIPLIGPLSVGQCYFNSQVFGFETNIGGMPDSEVKFRAIILVKADAEINAIDLSYEDLVEGGSGSTLTAKLGDQAAITLGPGANSLSWD